MPDFEAPQELQYLKMDPDMLYQFTIVRELERHKEFKLGDKPAPVFLVVDPRGKENKLTVSGSQLWNTLQLVEKAYGTFLGIPLKVKPTGEKTDRKYKVTVADDIVVQQKVI